MDSQSWISTHFALFIALIVITVFWVLPWKMVALWKAARNGDVAWFIILSLINTLAILEIVYIFAVDSGRSRKRR